jgi:hypothetical protein
MYVESRGDRFFTSSERFISKCLFKVSIGSAFQSFFLWCFLLWQQKKRKRNFGFLSTLSRFILERIPFTVNRIFIKYLFTLKGTHEEKMAWSWLIERCLNGWLSGLCLPLACPFPKNHHHTLIHMNGF